MPRNIYYFSLIKNALDIDKLQQSLSDMREAVIYIIIFAILAVIASYASKIILEKEKVLTISILLFILISTFGFFLIGSLFAYRYYSVLNPSSPDKKKIVEEDSVLQSILNSSNTSPIFNVFIAITCFVCCWIYLSNAYTTYTSRDKKIDTY
jgi:hypothetical protein